MSDLKPCPFCGGTRLTTRCDDIDGFIAHVACQDCDDMAGPMSRYKYDDKDEAIADAAERWNSRSIPPASEAVSEEQPVAWLRGVEYRHPEEPTDYDVVFTTIRPQGKDADKWTALYTRPLASAQIVEQCAQMCKTAADESEQTFGQLSDVMEQAICKGAVAQARKLQHAIAALSPAPQGVVVREPKPGLLCGDVAISTDPRYAGFVFVRHIDGENWTTCAKMTAETWGMLQAMLSAAKSGSGE